jgi:hypothetical protein
MVEDPSGRETKNYFKLCASRNKVLFLDMGADMLNSIDRARVAYHLYPP